MLLPLFVKYNHFKSHDAIKKKFTDLISSLDKKFKGNADYKDIYDGSEFIIREEFGALKILCASIMENYKFVHPLDKPFTRLAKEDQHRWAKCEEIKQIIHNKLNGS